MNRSAVMETVNVTLPVTGTGEESVAVTVTIYDPPVFAAGVPEMAPALLSVNPAGSRPELREYRYVPVPSVAIAELRLPAQAMPTVPVRAVGAATLSRGATQILTPAWLG